MARRSRVTGVNRLRKTLRRVDPEIGAEVREAVRESAEAITLDAVRFAPRDEGDLVRAIDYQLGRDGFTAVIGPGAKAAEIARRRAGSPFALAGSAVRLSRSNRHLLYQFFKGYWAEFGTKGGNGVPPQPARPFMQPAWDLNRPYAVKRTQGAVRNALERAARG